MKFHKQVKIPGMNQDQIVAALRETELEMRPMRTQYSFEKKFKTTNTFNDFNLNIEDEMVEVQGNGGYNVFSFTPYPVNRPQDQITTVKWEDYHLERAGDS